MQVTIYEKPKSLDDMVVDMARVSFNKLHSDYDEKDNTKLINYLMKHWHFTPFAHPTLSIVIEEIDLEIFLEITTNKELSAGICVHNYTIDNNKIKNVRLTGSIYALFQLFFSHLQCNSLDKILQEYCPKSRYAYITRCVDNGGAFGLGNKHDISLDNTNDSITLHIKAPIFVARQLGKHQVGFVWNEISRRYVNSEPEFFEPKIWRSSTTNKKQGSGSEHVDFGVDLYQNNKEAYDFAIEYGVCEEQARMILPQSMMTEWYMTANKKSWQRLLDLRLKEDTQLETRYIALQIEATLNNL